MRQSMVLVTFDIDGTLLIGKNKGVTHHRAFQHALRKVFNASVSTVPPPGTDLGTSKTMISQATGLTNIDPEKMQAFIAATEDYYCAHFDGKMEILPGVREALRVLCQMPNVTIGLCTGNFARIGWLKMEQAGLMQFFKDRIGGFGNNQENRTEILKEAIQNAEEKKQCRFDRIIHIGDSPADVTAANETGNISILVRTSPHTFHDFPKAQFEFANLSENRDELISIINRGRA